MKKLIKNGVCETHKQCIYTRFTKDRSTDAAEGKKKKRENADTARFKCYTNIHLIYSHAN